MITKKERKLSVLVPVFNEEDSIGMLYEQIAEAAEKAVREEKIGDYDVWFVNDGSTDASKARIRELHEKDERVRMIAFRRNFGKAAALQAGFRHARGDILVTMDADLQDDPAEIAHFIDALDGGYDLVSGWKRARKDPLEKRLPSKLFNAVTAGMSGVKLHDFNCGFKAYRQEVVECLDLYGEMHRYIPVLASRKGFRIGEIEVNHRKRAYGKSKYGFERYLRGLFDSMTTSFLTRFYDRPMYFFGRVGLILLLLGFIICLVLTVQWFMGRVIGDRPLLLLGVLCIILGVQAIATGFLGDMIVDATYRARYNESHIEEIL